MTLIPREDFVDSTDQLLDLLFDVMFAAVSPTSMVLSPLILGLSLERIAPGSVAPDLLFNCCEIC
jgi:hypothetical protein